MAFDPNKFVHTPAKVTLYVASWGPDKWVRHEYEFSGLKENLPLVFRYDQQKTCPNHEGGPVYIAYHYNSEGVKHGAEWLSDLNNNVAELWSAKKMLKVIVDVLKKSSDIDEPKYEFGTMTDKRNDVYATFANGLTVAVHIARPDGELEDFSPLWYSYADTRDKDVQCFPMDDKKAFLKACKDRLR